MSDEIAVSVRNISKRYLLYNRPQDRLKQSLFWRLGKSYAREFWALRDISFQVKKGEALGIVGRNGSGKSTLLQIIAGTLTPTGGEVQVNGRVAALLELGSGFNPDFTGRENVFMNGAILGLSHSQIEERFDKIADFAGIGEFIDQPVKVYSSGMLVRLAFSVAVSVDPDVLIVDEALAVGDIGFQQKCFNRIEEVVRRGTTMLFVSHDIYLVRNYCTIGVYLRDGQIVTQGDPEVATEAYLQDIVAERQMGAATPAMAWKVNPSVGGGGFGSKLGEIVSAELVSRDRGPSVSSVNYGDEIGIKITARVTPQIRNPNLAFQLRDFRGYLISGISTARLGIKFSDPEKEVGIISAIFWWPVVLSPGRYSFTVGLNDYQSASLFTVIHREFGVTPFTVLDDGQPFHGAVDLKVRCEKVSGL
jgi:lipopolysaccharide transport system ATP-binding protein